MVVRARIRFRDRRFALLGVERDVVDAVDVALFAGRALLRIGPVAVSLLGAVNRLGVTVEAIADVAVELLAERLVLALGRADRASFLAPMTGRISPRILSDVTRL